MFLPRSFTNSSGKEFSPPQSTAVAPSSLPSWLLWKVASPLCLPSVSALPRPFSVCALHQHESLLLGYRLVAHNQIWGVEGQDREVMLYHYRFCHLCCHLHCWAQPTKAVHPNFLPHQVRMAIRAECYLPHSLPACLRAQVKSLQYGIPHPCIVQYLLHLYTV